MIATIQIGNSDDKLSQREWSDFVGHLRAVVKANGIETHFIGGSPFDTEWQNACFVVAVRETEVELLIRDLRKVRRKFRQDSIALVLGDVRMVR